jgi:hypothetical protein
VKEGKMNDLDEFDAALAEATRESRPYEQPVVPRYDTPIPPTDTIVPDSGIPISSGPSPRPSVTAGYNFHIADYTPTPLWKTDLVKEFGKMEEMVLRAIEAVWEAGERDADEISYSALTRAEECLTETFMWLNRAIMQPPRIKLPGDEP